MMEDESRLQKVGWFAELGFAGDHALLVTARGKRTRGNKEHVVQYLQSGKPIVISPGVVRDIFDRSKIAGTSSLLTDGTYVWPDCLAHYVGRYDVALPDAFEEFMEANRWIMPGKIDTSKSRLPK